MSVTLGGVTLSDDLVLLGLETGGRVASSLRYTLGGVAVVQAVPLSGGRELVLQSENHLSLAEVQAVRDIEALAEPVTLVHHRGTFSVLNTGISGTITMIEV